MADQKFDVHQDIANRIVAAIETAPDFRLPWTRSSTASFARPVNVASGNRYNGINIVSLCDLRPSFPPVLRRVLGLIDVLPDFGPPGWEIFRG